MIRLPSRKLNKKLLASIIIIIVIAASAIAAVEIVYRGSAKSQQATLGLNLTLNQTSVLQGNSLQAEVNVISNENIGNVTLGSDAGLSGIQCSFEPSVGTENFTSTLTISVPNSTPTANYTVTITASSNSLNKNVTCAISVLSAKIIISGTVTVYFPIYNVRLNQIVFIDTQTKSTTAFNFPYQNMISTEASGAYSLTLENEHTYNVTASINWGPADVPFTFNDGDTLSISAPAGNSTISGQNYSFEF